MGLPRPTEDGKREAGRPDADGGTDSATSRCHDGTREPSKSLENWDPRASGLETPAAIETTKFSLIFRGESWLRGRATTTICSCGASQPDYPRRPQFAQVDGDMG